MSAVAGSADTLLEPPASEGAPKLSVRDLVKTLVTTSGETFVAVDHVSFDVAHGEFVCLIGPTGSGKTAILNVLAGLERPTSGVALIDGRPIAAPGPDRAVLFQEPALFPWLTVLGNVELALRLRGTPAAERHERAMSSLQQLGLEQFRGAQPHELSAGMRQRAAIARALAADPDVLLADEPFAQLDAQARELLQHEVQRFWLTSARRKTFVFVTHNVREAALLADRVLVMSARPGRLLEEVRIHTPRPRELDDLLVSRVVSELHELLMGEVETHVAREMGR
jgi:NitT/TauT family transport system ATP-binding protein